jgi:anti-sigma B factor antagonist
MAAPDRPSARPRPLGLHARRVGRWLVLTVVGALDLSSAAPLAVAVREHARRGERAICVDLGCVGLLDSAGVAALLNAHRTLTRLDGDLAVIAPPGPGLRVLTATAVVRALHVLPDVEALRRTRGA